MGWAFSAHGRNEKCIHLGLNKLKKLLRTAGCKWEVDIKMHLEEIWWVVEYFILVGQDRYYWWNLVNTIMSVVLHTKQGVC